MPTLLDRRADASIHVWFANYDGVRELLFPSLADAYAQWRLGDGGSALRRAIAGGHEHFMRLAQQALDHHDSDGAAAVERLLTSAAAVYPG